MKLINLIASATKHFIEQKNLDQRMLFVELKCEAEIKRLNVEGLLEALDYLFKFNTDVQNSVGGVPSLLPGFLAWMPTLDESTFSPSIPNSPHIEDVLSLLIILPEGLDMAEWRTAITTAMERWVSTHSSHFPGLTASTFIGRVKPDRLFGNVRTPQTIYPQDFDEEPLPVEQYDALDERERILVETAWCFPLTLFSSAYLSENPQLQTTVAKGHDAPIRPDRLPFPTASLLFGDGMKSLQIAA